jgi:hypothetical protein
MARKIVSDKFATRNRVNMLKWIFLGIYLFCVIGFQIIDTMKLMKDLCGRVDLNKVMLYTLVPNFLVFGLIIVILTAMPGWKSPFANTIGYACAKMSGCKKDFNTLLSNKLNNDLITKISENKSMIINEITPKNFDLFFSNLSNNNLLKVSYENLIDFEKKEKIGENLGVDMNNKRLPNKEYLDAFVNLFSQVVLKDLVAEGLWYLLAGALVISMSQNSIAEMECEKNIEEIKKEYEEKGKKSKMKNLKKQ